MSTQSTDTQAQTEIDALEQGSSLWQDAWRRLLKNRAAVVGAILVTLMMIASLTAPLIARYGTRFAFDEQHLTGYAKPPGARSVPWRHRTFYDADMLGFDKADLNGDGGVSAEELSTVLARVEFDRFDRHGDGVLDEDDLAHAPIVSLSIEGEPEGPILTLWAAYITTFEARFDQFDTHPDHLLSADELSAALKAVGGVDAPKLDQHFRALLEEAAASPGYLERHRVRLLGRALLETRCPTISDCPVPFEASRLFTDIFPISQARAFVREFDTSGNQQLNPDEFPGVPEPHTHLLGTDPEGRDLLTRILYGGRISFAVGLLATLVSFLIGVSWGATAGYLGGRVDSLMMRFVDILYGLPFMFLVILLMVIFGRDIFLLFVALGAVQWLTMSRIVRGQVISLKQREFVEAARSIGVSSRTIIFRHLIPNALGPIIVYATLTVPAVMLEEAFLSFLGLGVQAPMASFGTLVNAGAEDMANYPWLIIYPGLTLALTLLSLNFLGDGLRDALDPQAKRP